MRARVATCFAAVAAVLLAVPAAQAADVLVTANITTSETWTADNEYILTGVIYVTNGATLTIEPGTVIRGESESSAGANDPGTLVITRGSKIRALGTRQKPIVFTDLNDDNIGANPGTSPYDVNSIANRALTAQWGGLILLGRTFVANNTPAPDPTKEVQIEGLVATGGLGLYGNCDAFFPSPSISECEDDDSGTVRYVSIRYGGFNLSAANEINGLTLGAVGRETSIDHVEIFQNQDDGVEFFGGTVGVKNLIIANVGDDSIDYDEGWRGKAQFVFAMQGTPGSDRSDKGGEHDGAVSDASQPFAVPTIYNATFIGLGQKHFSGSSSNTVLHMRDNAGGRYNNSLFGDFGGASVLIEGGSSSATAANTSGQRAITPYSIDGTCSVSATACSRNEDCPVGESCDGFYLSAEISQFQLDHRNNDFWCIGRQEDSAVATLGRTSTLATQGLCGTATCSIAGTDCASDKDCPTGETCNAVPTSGSCLEDTDCGGGEVCIDSPRIWGGDAGKLQYDNGLFSNASLNNSYASCASPLPIRQLTRQFVLDATRPEPVAQIDPRLSNAGNAGNAGLVPNDGFFTPAPYTGAFGESNWAEGWSTMSRLGYFPPKPQVLVSANITSSDTWTSDNEYILDQVIYVTNGATLTIEKGTVVRGQSESSSGANDPGTLVITRGSKLFINGTRDEPVVFTNLDDTNVGPYRGMAPYDNLGNARAITGTWGGLILLGRTYVANNTPVPDPTKEVQVEGLTATGGLGLYGDCFNTLPGAMTDLGLCFGDDSGRINYLSIRYGGFNLSAANEINGLTLGAVGDNTDLDYIEVFQNKDDCNEWFGGSASIRHLFCYGQGDDGLDYDEGWRGKAQFVFNVQGAPGTDRSDKGGEHDGAVSDASQPFAVPAIYNATFIGLGQKNFSGSTSNTALHMRDNAGGRYTNSFFADFGGASVIIEGGSSSPTAPNTSGERAITSYQIDGSCRNLAGQQDPGLTSCSQNSNCPSSHPICRIDGFFRGPVSEFELDHRNNSFWCIGRQEESTVAALGRGLSLATEGLCGTGTCSVAGTDCAVDNDCPSGQTCNVAATSGTCLENSDCGAGEVCIDSPRTWGGDAGKLQYDNGLFSNAALENEYLACAADLPIRSLIRGFDLDPARPNTLVTLDPRPTTASTLNATTKSAPADGFFTPAAYRGAFGAGDNWADGWTNAARLGLFPQTDSMCDVATPDAVPNEVGGLEFLDTVTMKWVRPAGADMNLQAYDVLRSANAGDFVNGPAFIASDTDDLQAADAATPLLGNAFYYLVRAENDCGTGSLGADSTGTLRPAP